MCPTVIFFHTVMETICQSIFPINIILLLQLEDNNKPGWLYRTDCSADNAFA